MSADNDKRAAQTAFTGAENIQELYRQILSEGHILAGGENLTLQITQETFPEIDQPDMQHEIGLEPER